MMRRDEIGDAVVTDISNGSDGGNVSGKPAAFLVPVISFSNVKIWQVEIYRSLLLLYL